MKSLKGSKKLGRWISSPKVKILERINQGRTRDALIFLKLLGSGATVALLPLRHKAGDSGRAKTRTEARRNGVEAYPIGADLLLKCRAHNPSHIIVFLVDHDDYYVSKYADWQDPTKRRRLCSRGSSADKILLPTQFMLHVPAHKVL